MTKYYCDRCGIECNEKDLKEIRIPKENTGYGTLATKPIEVCSTCKTEYDKITDMFVDMRIAIFSKFFPMKGGAE